MIHTGRHKIVVLETDKSRRDDLKSMISRWGYLPFTFENFSICLENLVFLDPDLVISGNLIAENTVRFINSLKVIRRSLPMLILSSDNAVRDYIKNNSFDDVQLVQRNAPGKKIRSVITRVLNSPPVTKCDLGNPLLIGNSPAVLKLRSLVPKLNRTKEAILIEGESGTGKELFARVLHSNSDWRHLPFISVNAVSLPYQLLDEALFGRQGLDFFLQQRKNSRMLNGRSNVTLFIKKVEALPSLMQAKIGQLLENSASNAKNGGQHIRLITSASKDLMAQVQRGLFRADLIYRLKVLTVKLPPLRDRIADVSALADYFHHKWCIELGQDYRQLSSNTRDRFGKHRWPGNIKELATVIRQIIISGDEEGIVGRLNREAGSFSIEPKRGLQNDTTEHLCDLTQGGEILELFNRCGLKSIRYRLVADIEKKIIEQMLNRVNWNRKQAAAALQVSYKSLLNKIRELNIN
jgi:two-component system nitrogen regulation response regulator GlnG